MKDEGIIQTYMNFHNSRDNVVYTWILWNYNELDKIWNKTEVFNDEKLFKSLVKEAYKDKFVIWITGNGKYRAHTTTITESTSNCREVAEKEIYWDEP